MKFISAGHVNAPGKTYDPGAIGVSGRKEADETIRIRKRVVEILKSKGYLDIVTDGDTESLSSYLARIKPGDGSVVCEFHFNAFNGKATGTEVIVGNDADRLDRSFAQDLADKTAEILGIAKRNGGVLNEGGSHRGRLGLMREAGIVALVEVCFIDNSNDMEAYDRKFEELCHGYASIIQKYDDLIK